MSKGEMEKARCPKCQSPEVNKLLSAPNINIEAISKKSSTSTPQVNHHRCGSNTCSTFELSGHKK
jgi:hypothetical protein